MLDKIVLTVDVTQEERDRIEALAHEHGYTTAGEYLLSLAADEQTQEELMEEFRQGWQAAKNGQTIPASKLWEALNSDE